MEHTVVLWYRQNWAYYKIRKEAPQGYSAFLLSYKGSPKDCPPQEFTLLSEGRRWNSSSCLDPDLLNQLGYAIELQKANEEKGITNLRFSNDDQSK